LIFGALIRKNLATNISALVTEKEDEIQSNQVAHVRSARSGLLLMMKRIQNIWWEKKRECALLQVPVSLG
jgi:hypothetical protein